MLVGALDVELHAACDAEHIPAVLINTTTSSDTSAETYIRKDYARFKVMGARKVRFLQPFWRRCRRPGYGCATRTRYS